MLKVNLDKKYINNVIKNLNIYPKNIFSNDLDIIDKFII